MDTKMENSQSDANSLDSPVTAKKKKLDLVWQNFTQLNGLKKARCNVCQEEMTNTTTVLRRHLDSKHKDITSLPTQTLSKATVTRLAQLDSAFADVLAMPSLSLNVFTKPPMQKFLSLMNKQYTLPKSNSTLKNKLLQRYESMEALMKKCIKDLTMRPSITLDLWTDDSFKHGYLGVTLHFVKGNQLRRIFLGLSEMEQDHTAESILSATEELLSKFDLSLDGIFKIVTDNGSNVVAAFKDIQTIDFNTEYVDDEDEDEEDELRNMSNIPDESILLDAFPQRLSCFAHSLQLVILKFFKDDVIYFSGYKKMMVVVRKVKISPKLKKELHERSGTTVILPSTTRWGSVIEVIKKFLEVKQSLGEMQSLKTLMPTAEEVYELEGILQIFRPFVAALKRIQAEKSVTISHVLEYIKALQHSLGEAEGGRSSKLLAAIKERFACVLTKDRICFDQVFTIATALDPSTTHALNDAELRMAAEWINQMMPAVPEVINQENRTKNSNATLDALIDNMKQKQQEMSRRSTSHSKSWIMRALHNVRVAEVDAVSYWSTKRNTENHNLAVLALEVLSVPATSAPIERIFSLAGLSTKGIRNRTEFELLNAKLVVSCNMSLFGE